MSLTTEQVAARLGITPPAVRKLVEREQLQPERRGTRPLTFDEDVVAALQGARWVVEQRRVGSRLGDACAEYDRLVAAQVRAVSRCGHAEPSPERVEGGAERS